MKYLNFIYRAPKGLHTEAFIKEIAHLHNVKCEIILGEKDKLLDDLKITCKGSVKNVSLFQRSIIRILNN